MEASNSKISGYLEKKGKRKMMGCYKKYWFVLEGGLLLYYRSKADYETISPCKGSINLGPPCKIKPCASSAGVFQIQTRMAVVTLRAENRDQQNRWMQALMSEINPNKSQHRMSHFRYSIDDLQQDDQVEAEIESPQKSEDPNSRISTENIIQRLQKMGAQSCIPQGDLTAMNKARKTNSREDPGLENNNGNQPDHIYQRITTELIDNHIYSVPDKVVAKNAEKAMTLPNKSAGNPHNSSIRIRSLNDANRPTTYILENDTYSVSIRQKPNRTRENSFVVENEQYACADPRRDLNENVVATDNGYAEIADVFQETADAVDESHCRKGRTKDKRGSRLVKRPSFLRRVWKRKERSKVKEVAADEDIYESVPPGVVEKLAAVNDGTAVQMLTELQNILENKMPIIIDQLCNDVRSPSYSSKSETSSDYKPDCNIDNDLYCDIDDLRGIDCPSVLSKFQQNETIQPFHDIPSNAKPIELPPKKKKNSKPMDDFKSIDEILQDLDVQQSDDSSSSDNNNKVRKLVERFSDSGDREGEGVVLRGDRKGCVYRDDIEPDELSKLLEQLAKVASAPVLKPGVTTSLDVSNLEDLELKKLLPGRRRRFSEPDYDVPRPHKSLTIIPKMERTAESIIGSTRFFGPILKQSDMVAINNNCGPSTSREVVHNSQVMAEIRGVQGNPMDIDQKTVSDKAKTTKTLLGRSDPSDSSRLNSMTPDSLEASPTPPPKKFGRDSRRSSEVSSSHSSSHVYYKFVDSKTFHESRGKHPQAPRASRESVCIVDNDIYDSVKCLPQADITGRVKEVNRPKESEEYADSLEICRNEVSTGF